MKFDRTVYSLQSFLDSDVKEWGTLLKDHHKYCMQDEASYSQREAWLNCYNVLQRELKLLALSENQKSGIYIVFEYELPRERGRRPDVLILSGDNLLVLEFKGFGEENQSHIDQVKHYARDLRSYHEKSHCLNVVPILVLVNGVKINKEVDGVSIISADKLQVVLKELIKDNFKQIIEWFNSEYVPLPSLLQSAQILFKEEHFPQIKAAHSAGIPKTLEKLLRISVHSKQNESHHLALITGVPGAGKTLVGLQFVFDTILQDVNQKAVFLSGNGPLVEVLQFSLKNKHFVQSVHGFLKQYAHSSQLPSEDIIIYDEAQRAWDAEKVSASNRFGNNSEPTDFINIGNRKDYLLLIGLIGEGQEIYLGEESGMKLWTEAITQSSKKWLIHCPEKLKNYFKDQQLEIVEDFNLTKSLRTHQALTLQSWVQHLLDNEISEAKNISKYLFKEDYPIYITRDLERAKNYMREKYENEPNKTFGLIASSKSRILSSYGVMNDFNSTKAFRVSQYYVDDTHQSYCRNLNNTVTEFGCQGLELDMPILAWEADWVYDNGWHDKIPNRKAKDSHNLRKNSYRVLLTRGRDGLIIFVPDDSILTNTYLVLIEAGCKDLK